MTKPFPSGQQQRSQTAFCKFPDLENPVSYGMRPARLERATYGSECRRRAPSFTVGGWLRRHLSSDESAHDFLRLDRKPERTRFALGYDYRRN